MPRGATSYRLEWNSGGVPCSETPPNCNTAALRSVRGPIPATGAGTRSQVRLPRPAALIVKLRARLNLADVRWRGRLKGIARAREVVCDFLVGDNGYGSTGESLDAYFLPAAMAARRGRYVRRPAFSSPMSTRRAPTSRRDERGPDKRPIRRDCEDRRGCLATRHVPGMGRAVNVVERVASGLLSIVALTM
jgi:hypothetical protein